MLNFFKPGEDISEDQQYPLHSLFYEYYTFFFPAIFISVSSTIPLSVYSLFFNPFLSNKFEGLGGATKTVTTTESGHTTTESAVHIRQQNVQKKTTENT